MTALVREDWKWGNLSYLYGRTVKTVFDRLVFCCIILGTETEFTSDQAHLVSLGLQGFCQVFLNTGSVLHCCSLR